MSEEQVSPQSLDLSPQESGESPQEEINSLQEENPQASGLMPQVSQKTQCVKPGRDSGMGILQSAAKKAAHSNSRSDVHEYMRLRRGYV